MKQICRTTAFIFFGFAILGAINLSYYPGNLVIYFGIALFTVIGGWSLYASKKY